jgi:SAM domain (Sterile alpha motif)
MNDFFIFSLSFPSGIGWSFRFASQKKKMVIANLPHLDIRDWLKRLDLLDYEDNFRKFFGVEEMIDLNESDIKDLGVKNSSHRARIISSLVALKGENQLPTRTMLSSKRKVRKDNGAWEFKQLLVKVIQILTSPLSLQVTYQPT